MPGVQNPHCRPWASRNAACSGCSASPEASPPLRPSTVATSCPSTCTANIRQDRTASPSNSTVQAPADAVLAPDVRAGESQLVAQEVGEEQPRLHRALVAHAVDRGRPASFSSPQRYALAGSAARRQNSTMKRREALAKLTGRERYVDDPAARRLSVGHDGAQPRAARPRHRDPVGKDVDWSSSSWWTTATSRTEHRGPDRAGSAGARGGLRAARARAGAAPRSPVARGGGGAPSARSKSWSRPSRQPSTSASRPPRTNPIRQATTSSSI